MTPTQAAKKLEKILEQLKAIEPEIEDNQQSKEFANLKKDTISLLDEMVQVNYDVAEKEYQEDAEENETED